MGSRGGRLWTLLAAWVLCASIATADVRLVTAVYDVVTEDGRRDEAQFFYGNGWIVARVAPDDPARGMRTPLFETLEIEDGRYRFGFAPGVLAEDAVHVELWDVDFLHDGFLMREVSLCDGATALRLERGEGEWGDCPEIEVPAEEQQGDWDACSWAYQAPTRERCGDLLPASGRPLDDSAEIGHVADLVSAVDWTDRDRVLAYCYRAVDWACPDVAVPRLLEALEAETGTAVGGSATCGSPPVSTEAIDSSGRPPSTVDSRRSDSNRLARLRPADCSTPSCPSVGRHRQTTRGES